MVDKVAEGDAIKKGFIAQEVEAIIPEAVNSSRRFVPDIYSIPSSMKFDQQQRTLAVTLPKPHALKAGDRVQIMADDSRLELGVTDVPSATKFVVGKVEKAPKEIFVFGKEVSDFRILNYDRIFVTGIGAIQELDRQVQALKKSEARFTELEQKTARIAELEQKAARVDSLERKLAALEKLVAGLTREDPKIQASNQERDKRISAREQLISSQNRTVAIQASNWE
jgi:virulence-associated protein VagC